MDPPGIPTPTSSTTTQHAENGDAEKKYAEKDGMVHRRPSTHRRHTSEIADAIAPPDEEGIEDAESLASISAPPDEEQVEEGSIMEGPPPKVYSPFSPPVIASLMASSIFGVLARLGLLALTTYDGKAIFPLAWVQGAGCLIMGFALGLKDQIGA